MKKGHKYRIKTLLFSFSSDFGRVRDRLRRKPILARLRGERLGLPKDPEMESRYDFSGGVTGKYAGRYAEGTNVVVLAPDVSKAFPNSDAVNSALRAVMDGPQESTQSTPR